MNFRRFIIAFPTQIAINAIIGAGIIFVVYNAGIQIWLGDSLPKLTYWQAICVYLFFGVLRGDYRVRIDD